MNAQNLASAFAQESARFTRRSDKNSPFHLEFETAFGRVQVLKYANERCELRAPLALFAASGDQEQPSGGVSVLAHTTRGRVIDGKYESDAAGETWFSRTFRGVAAAQAFLASVLA